MRPGRFLGCSVSVVWDLRIALRPTRPLCEDSHTDNDEHALSVRRS